MVATKTRFAFASEGETLVGNLFLPKESKPTGVVVAVGPLTSVKEQAAGAYARAMAERGYAALAFDYRYFGESSGSPRQFQSPDANIEDIKNAATALLADGRLTKLPLFGLGVCFGAGPMVRSVAEDSRFRAFAGVAGVYTDNAKTVAAMGSAYQTKLDRGRAAEQEWRETGKAETIPAVAPDAAMSPCRYGRPTSSTEPRAARCPTTSTPTRSSRSPTVSPLMRAAQRTY